MRARRASAALVLVVGLVSTGCGGAASIESVSERVVGNPGTKAPALEPLPVGEIESMGVCDVMHYSLSDLEREAETVFVGRVESIGGSELIGVDQGGLRFTYHRVRTHVEEVLTGAVPEVVDIGLLDCVGGTYAFEVGDRCLVFAEHRTIMDTLRALFPVGYEQGVFQVVGDVASGTHGQVSIASLRARL